MHLLLMGQSSRTVSTRLSHGQYAALQRFLARHRTDASTYFRAVTMAVADGDTAAAQVLLEDLHAALKAAPPPPPPPKALPPLPQHVLRECRLRGLDPAAYRRLPPCSQDELVECRARGMDPEIYRVRKATAVRTAK